MSDPTWIDSLEPFLHSSNEDECVAKFFDRFVIEELYLRIAGQIRWLDIGSGLGTKVVRCARSLSRRMGRECVSIVLVDPDLESRTESTSKLLQDLDHYASAVTAIPVSLQSFLQDTPEISPYAFNLITAMHLHYSASTSTATSMLFRSNYVTDTNVWFLVSESTSSDLHKLRRDLGQAGIMVPESTLDEFARYLQQEGMTVLCYEITGQNCLIERNELEKDDCHWLFPFLLGCTTQHFNSLDSMTKDITRNIARDYLSNLPSYQLTIPDTAYIAFSRDK